MVAALLITTPRQVPKSSTDDLTLQRFTPKTSAWERRSHRDLGERLVPPRPRGVVEPGIAASRTRSTRITLTSPVNAASAHDIIAVLRRDSDLEAFSRNPTDGSFAPLVSRPST